MKTNRKTKLAKVVGVILVFALAISSVGVYGNVAEAKTKTSTKLKKACKAAAKKTGNAKKLNPYMTSSNPANFPIELSPKKISSVYSLFGNEVYSLRVVKAKSSKYAKMICKSLAEYQNRRPVHDLTYTKEERQVMKNGIYGRKGKYVWYISMSTDKKKNQAGEAVLKKKL